MTREKNKPINLYNIRYRDSMKPINWRYYAKFYPQKAEAIQALRLDTGLGLAEAKEVVGEIFVRFERGEVERFKENAEHFTKSRSYESNISAQEDLKKIGKGIGCGCFTLIYIFLRAIFNLAGITSGKKRRRKRW